MNARSLATKILLDILQKGVSLTSALEQQHHTLAHNASAEQQQQKAFVQALCYGVLRHYFELETILNAILNKPFKAKELEAKILALVGLYQLKYMRVKEHAAVAETVAAAKRMPWAKSVLNATFRRYLREREQLDALQHPQLNHPAWLYQTLQHDWPEYAAQLMQQNNLAPPMVLRCNAAKVSRAAYLELLQQADIAARPTECGTYGIVLEQALPVEALPHFAAGWVSVQDSAAQLASELLAPQPKQRVLDLCAAPGGKTCALLEQTPNLQAVWAVDIDAQRLQRVSDNLQRLQLHATLCVGDALQPDTWWDGQPFERILVDAPCSATGVIRRHPDIKMLRRAEDIDALAELQQQILHAAWQLLAPQGILLYATCSILQQENAAQIAQFLATHSDAQEVPIQADWGLAVQHGRQILTGMQQMDGFYYARLQKQ